MICVCVLDFGHVIACTPGRKGPDRGAVDFGAYKEHPFEGLSKLVVEKGVDEWVDGRVHVAQPRGQHEEGHGGHE